MVGFLIGALLLLISTAFNTISSGNEMGMRRSLQAVKLLDNLSSTRRTAQISGNTRGAMGRLGETRAVIVDEVSRKLPEKAIMLAQQDRNSERSQQQAVTLQEPGTNNIDSATEGVEPQSNTEPVSSSSMSQTFPSLWGNQQSTTPQTQSNSVQTSAGTSSVSAHALKGNLFQGEVGQSSYSIPTDQKIRDQAQSVSSTSSSNVVATSPAGESPPSAMQECKVPETKEVHVENPTWTASYPGSGAKLTWKLVRALTGIYTGDDHDHNGRVKRSVVVAVKTHFPSHTPPEVMEKPQLDILRRVILLVRNPLTALPSFHNFVYEQEHGLRNHSTRAPVDFWIRWRNELFEAEIQKWVGHIQHWVHKFPREEDKLFLLPFEHLTSQDGGISMLQAMGGYLARAGEDVASRMTPTTELPCIWENFVNKGQVPGEKARRQSHRSGGPRSYPYTEDQLNYALQALRQLKNESSTFAQLAALLDEYIDDIEQRKVHLAEIVQG